MVYGAGGLTPRSTTGAAAARFPPMFVYRYEAMRELLYRFRDWDESPHEGVSIIHASASRPGLPDHDLLHADGAAGETTLPLKQTANLLVSPFSGQGSMTVGEQRHALEPFGHGRRAQRELRSTATTPPSR